MSNDALAGKVAIITGAAGGLGCGIAEVFVEQGALVMVADIDGTAAATTAAALGDSATPVACDIADEASVAAMVATTLERHGRIDVLVNNAGINFVKPFETITVADWDRVMSVDLRGTFLCTHAVVPHMLKQGSGNVIGIASVHSRAGLHGAAPYDAAKWGMVGMTKSLAVEFAPRGLRFNCVSPGLMDTAMWQELLRTSADADACVAHWNTNIPMKRPGQPREVGTVCAFLASDAASYVTGANYEVDGGMLAQLATPPDYDTDTIAH